MKVFKFLNRKCLSAPPSKQILLKDSLFGAPTSHEKLIEGMLNFKNSLYYHIDAFVEDLISLLLWWKEHEKKNSNVEKISL
jgi:hypothetical protein